MPCVYVRKMVKNVILAMERPGKPRRMAVEVQWQIWFEHVQTRSPITPYIKPYNRRFFLQRERRRIFLEFCEGLDNLCARLLIA